ncbi:WbqC family protein [Aquimarina sp. ERC-38]|uniref:WbqC family protein n=1 Tax=Aquimarina sp. ERC-38 TaxID=2949996 RepID=UPI003A599A78
MENALCLLHPAYLGSIAQYVAIVRASEIIFEDCDNYQKQTYRNRTYIYGANGKLLLTVPFLHSGEERRLYKEVRIQNDFNWQLQHRKSIETAYRTSPFFEYYEDDFQILYAKKFTYLLDYNYQCFEVVKGCLQLEVPFSKTDTYQKEFYGGIDARNLIVAKKETIYHFTPYVQVFSEKHGFIPNLSIIDLLFNEGPNAITYLQNQSLSKLDTSNV